MLACCQVIPCFGVHPWFAHLHSVQPVSHITEILQAKSEEDFGQLKPEVRDCIPSTTWEARMRSLLEAHPRAGVGEFGLDRAAVIPGTRCSCFECCWPSPCLLLLPSSQTLLQSLLDACIFNQPIIGLRAFWSHIQCRLFLGGGLRFQQLASSILRCAVLVVADPARSCFNSDFAPPALSCLFFPCSVSIFCV